MPNLLIVEVHMQRNILFITCNYSFSYSSSIINIIRRESGIDNFLLVHGTKILGSLAAISGCGVLFCFRRALLIRPRANFAFYAGLLIYFFKKKVLKTNFVGVSFIPLGGLTAVRVKYFDESLVLGKLDCLMCAQTRSACFQVAAGFIYPLICSPIAAIATARRHLTYSTVPMTRLPHGTDLMRQVYFVRKDILFFILMLNVIVSSGIARRQFVAISDFHKRYTLGSTN